MNKESILSYVIQSQFEKSLYFCYFFVAILNQTAEYLIDYEEQKTKDVQKRMEILWCYICKCSKNLKIHGRTWRYGR